MKLVKKIAVSLLGIVCAAGAAGGVAGCKAKKNPVETPTNNTTYRCALPNDGSLPTAHTGLENIGYMATRLDNQSFYHAYANNSTKSLGYEQVTQTWKDFKGKELSGYDGGVMICSDLSYSSFVKSGTQACFINDSAYMRSSGKPGKNTTATTASWNTSAPEYYDRATYLEKYGEFSTELSVYVINEDTVDRYDEVVVNDNGTYSQKYYLKSNAACYYQYGMKTRGNLKGYPDFDYINITFTFDDTWQVLESYCEEKAKISPKALGGSPMTSNSKTTTTFDYSQEDLDGEHYGYFDSYYKQYLGADLKPGGSTGTNGEEVPDIINVLAGAFSGVISDGQQFNLNLKLGETDYEGKVFLKLGNLSDVLGSIDARIALGKAGSGKQDLYIDFKNGAVNAYYSDDFAVTANIDAVKTVVGQFSEWVKRFEKPSTSPASFALAEGESSGLDLSALLASLQFNYTDTSVNVALKTDDLLGTGIGADVSLAFDRQKGAEGSTYSFKEAKLSSITYDETSIALSGGLTNDNSSVISRNPSQTVADLAEYAASIYGMLDSNTVKVNLKLNGEGGKTISLLDGIVLDGTAFVELGSEMATSLGFTVKYKDLSAKLSAYYDVNIHGGNYGKVYLSLDELNGVEQNIKVYSNINDTINAVNELISVINESSAAPAALAADGGEGMNSLTDIINGVLNLNFGKIFGELYASNSQIRVCVNLDEIINGVGVDVKGMKFGTAALALGLDSNKKANLGLSLEALGLTLGVEGSDVELTEPALAQYVDATALINIVKAATVEAKKIISAQDIEFDIDATVTADDVPLSVKGGGEVVWSNGKIKVAVALDLSVADGTNSDKVKLTLVYDDTVGEDKPLAKFAVNQLAMEIYRKDLKEISDTVKIIKNNIDLLINGEKTGNADAKSAINTVTGTNGVQPQADGAALTIEDILTNASVQKVLSAVLGFAGDLNFSLDKTNANGNYNQIIVNHAKNGNLTLTSNGNLALSLLIKDNSGAEIVDLQNAEVKAGSGAKISAVRSALDEMETSTTATDAPEKFVKIVYTYLFAVIEDELSVENVLGSKTYTVKAFIDGDASQVPQLAGVKVDATLYYGQGLNGTTVTKDKIVEADLNLDIKGTQVVANARYAGQTLYISLDKIGTTELTDIKFKANRNDVYSLCEQVVSIITDDKIIGAFASLLHPAKEQGATTSYAVAMSDGAQNALSDVLSKLLTLDFAKAVKFSKVDGANVAVVQIDYIMETLGVNAPKLGAVTAAVNPDTHKITASLAYAGAQEPWATLSAEATTRRTYADGWTNGYIDIGFAKTLVSDLVNTLTDNATGEVHKLFTFSGTVNIKLNGKFSGIPINANIPITISSLTAGIDSEGDFYLSIYAKLTKQTVSASIIPLPITLTEKRDIVINYSKGYITFGREVETSSPKYKIMTFDYLLDNMFNKSEGDKDSPIRWLIGMDANTVWNSLAGNFNVSSGLTSPQDYYLYGALAQADKESGAFYLSQLLNGFAVNVGGKEVSSYGTGDKGATQLGLSADYYAFDINAKRLTNNLLLNLYAGIMRSDEQGVYGFKLKTALDQAGFKIDLDLALGKYHEGATADTAVDGVAAQPNYLKTFIEDYKGANDGKGLFAHDFSDEKTPTTTPKFGCYNTEGAGSYEASHVLDRINLTVVGTDGSDKHTVDLAIGSTVHLRNPFSPTWVNDEHTSKLIYTDAESNDLGTEITINEDTSVYAKAVSAIEVKFILGVQDMVVSGAFAQGETLPAYPLSGYKFLGWYNDAALTSPVTNESDITNTVNNVKTVYGYFAREEVTVNGVKYAFSTDTQTFSVSGYDSEAIKPYTVSGSTLKLESSIDGYSVTAINAQAFKAMGKTTEEGGIGAGLKNVIVPETITVVGAEAFMDNYGIESVVFLAQSVHFGGTTGSGDGGNRYVFYGCAVSSSDDTNTKLKLYLNNYTCDDSSHWDCFKFESVVFGSNKYYHVRDNGGVISSGWSYVEYTQTGVDMNGLNCLVGGIAENAMTAEDIRASVIAELNGRTKGYGYVNAYAVTVSEGYSLDGKLHEVNVNVIEEKTGDRYYALTVDSHVAECGADFYVSEESKTTYEGTVYVKAGATVSLTATADEDNVYAFATWSGNANFAAATSQSTTFVMAASVTSVSAEWSANYAENTYVYSAIPFTYVGTQYAAGNNKLEKAAVGKKLQQPTANGYTFVGWATGDDNLQFTDDTTVTKSDYITYYAIWAVNHEGIDFDLNTSGNTLGYNITNGVKVYNWYAATDSSFTGSEIPAEISTVNTVFRARLQYALSIEFKANSTDWYYSYKADSSDFTDMTITSSGTIIKTYTVQNGSKFGSGNLTYTLSDGILEGYSVELYRYYTNALVIRIYDGTTAIGTYEIKGHKTNDKANWRGQLDYDGESYHYVQLVSANWTLNSANKSLDEVPSMTGCYYTPDDKDSGATGDKIAYINSMNGTAQLLVQA